MHMLPCKRSSGRRAWMPFNPDFGFSFVAESVFSNFLTTTLFMAQSMEYDTIELLLLLIMISWTILFLFLLIYCLKLCYSSSFHEDQPSDLSLKRMWPRWKTTNIDNNGWSSSKGTKQTGVWLLMGKKVLFAKLQEVMPDGWVDWYLPIIITDFCKLQVGVGERSESEEEN